MFGPEMAWWVFMVAMMLAVGILLYRNSRYLGRQRSERSPWLSHDRGAASRPGRPADASTEAAGWEVQMHDFARQMKGELDSKMSALQALVAEADRAAARLERAMQGSSDAGDFLPTSQAGTLHSPSNSSSSRREEIYTLADYGLPPAEIAHRTGTPVGEVELMLSLRGKK